MTFILAVSALLIVLFSFGTGWLLVDETFDIEHKVLKGVTFVLLSGVLLALTSVFYTMVIWPTNF